MTSAMRSGVQGKGSPGQRPRSKDIFVVGLAVLDIAGAGLLVLSVVAQSQM